MGSGPARDKGQSAPITALLTEYGKGNRLAGDRLIELVYAELRRVAAAHMRRERADHTLQATALVNEAWIRLGAEPDVSWQNRVHFFAVASRLMRQILVDHARRRIAGKRGGKQRQITMVDQLAVVDGGQTGVLELNDALERLEALDPRASRIVELHFFGGLSFEEIAGQIGISARTVKRDWRMARAWLRSQLSERN